MPLSVIGLNHPAREARVGNWKKQTSPDRRRKEDTARSVGRNTFRGTHVYAYKMVYLLDSPEKCSGLESCMFKYLFLIFFLSSNVTKWRSHFHLNETTPQQCNKRLHTQFRQLIVLNCNLCTCLLVNQPATDTQIVNLH